MDISEKIAVLAEFAALPMAIGRQEDFYAHDRKRWRGKNVYAEEVEIVKGTADALKISITTYPAVVSYTAEIPMADGQVVEEREIYDKGDITPYKRAVALMRPYYQDEEECKSE